MPTPTRLRSLVAACFGLLALATVAACGEAGDGSTTAAGTGAGGGKADEASCLFGGETWELEENPRLQLGRQRTIVLGQRLAKLTEQQILDGVAAHGVHEATTVTEALQSFDGEEMYRQTITDKQSGERYTIFTFYAGDTEGGFVYRQGTLDRVAVISDSFFDVCAVPAGGAGGGTCTVDGRTYAAGESFPAPDGCNTCTCQPEGWAACTELFCLPPEPTTCSFNGQELQVGDRVPDVDGCNTCTCQEGGYLACTELACAPR